MSQAAISTALLNLVHLLEQQQQLRPGREGGEGEREGEGGGGGRGGLEPHQKRSKLSYASGICPDDQCQMKLYFPMHEASVECPGCGQRHSVADIRDRQELREEQHQMEINVQQARTAFLGKKTPSDLVRVRGISNYQCKLLSPLLTTHGMDSKTESAKPLTELGMSQTFNCSKFATRAFSIEESQLETGGYGRDRSGSVRYLLEMLRRLKAANNQRTDLVPLHADGDGHCLVHAISRCLVGRELFWHSLRHSLHAHLTLNLHRYKDTFKDFYEEEEWEKIIAEAGPDFQPEAGEVHGLCNIHVFGLANVLQRPILLLDSLSGITSKGDYSGIFLPALHPPEACCTKDATTGKMKLNSPIVVAWSSSGRNHFVPLVPIRGQPLPKLPPSLRPKVWGVDEALLFQYVTIDDEGCIELCGGKLLSDAYMQKLVNCMENLFFQRNGVHLNLVADVHQQVFRKAGYVGVKSEHVVETTKSAVREKRLFRCLICNSLVCIPSQWLERGGELYVKATSSLSLEEGLVYKFPMDGVTASYSAKEDRLLPIDVSLSLSLFLFLSLSFSSLTK